MLRRATPEDSATLAWLRARLAPVSAELLGLNLGTYETASGDSGDRPESSSGGGAEGVATGPQCSADMRPYLE